MTASLSPVQTTSEYFESIYADAHRNSALVPWADERPQPALVNWLNAVAPSLIRCGARVAVVGCGLGDDARELMNRGYDVTAFDCSDSCIQWAKSIDPENARCYQVADLFSPPIKWRHRFDLVVEVNTIQSLSPDLHASAMKAIADLVSPHGHLLVICRCGDEPALYDDGPPWAMTESELVEVTEASGLKPVEPVSIFMDDEDPPTQRLRGLFIRQ